MNIPIPYKCELANQLIPANASIKESNSEYDWESQSESQSFELGSIPKLYGWYMLEVTVCASEAYLDAQFTLLHKSKARSNHPILLANKRTIKRVIYIPKLTEKILFSPAGKKSKYSIQSLKFVKITKKLAIKLMHKKLKTFYPNLSYTFSLSLWRHYRTFYNEQQHSSASYSDWIDKKEQRIINKEKSRSTHLKFTILLHTSERLNQQKLLKTLNSISYQSYKNWRLVIIVETEHLDKLIKLAENSLNTTTPEKVAFLINNTQVKEEIEQAASPYFITISDRSIFAKDALSVYAKNAIAEAGNQIIYSDDDLIADDDSRSSPNFKPDWNPDLILSQNYIGDSICINADTLRKLYTTSFFNRSDILVYSLLTEAALTSLAVKHIPLVLNHKNMQLSKDKIQSSTELKVLKNKLNNMNASVTGGKTEGTYKVLWPIPKIEPLVSIIIPTHDAHLILKQAIESITKLTDYSNFELIIINNRSKKNETKKYFNQITLDHRIRVVDYNKPFNYSKINNFGVSHARGSIIALLNNDVEVITPSWLSEMVSHAIRPQIGCVGAMLYYPDNRIQHAGVVVGLGGCAGHSHKFFQRGHTGYQNRLVSTQNYSAVTAACLVLEKKVFEEVNGLNEEHLAVAFNDVDLCLKIAKKGYRNVWTPWAELYHHESLSRGEDNTKEKRARLTSEIEYMKETWMTTTLVDPYYSPYLTKIREDFSIAL